MDRRTFLSAASAAMLTQVVPAAAYGVDDKQGALKPMAVGLLVSPPALPRRSFAAYTTLASIIAFCQLDGYVGGFTPPIGFADEGSAA